MTHILKLSQPDAVIHLKAYGGLKVEGVDQTQVQCEIDAPQLATLIEEEGHVYLTANSTCNVTVPMVSTIKIEKGMGSVSIKNIQGSIEIDKVLGNLVMIGIQSARVVRTGGNCAIQDASGDIIVEKVGGNLVVDKAGSLSCEKVGGICLVKNIQGNLKVEKVGGKFRAEQVSGLTEVDKVGADFCAIGLTLNEDLQAGGDIRLYQLNLNNDVDLRAGSDVILSLAETLSGAKINLDSGGHHIRIIHQDDDIDIDSRVYVYEFGDNKFQLDIAAGGKILIGREFDTQEDQVGDLSSYFSYEENALNELIKVRIDTATRRSEAKIKAAEIRLEQIRDNVEKNRNIHLNIELDNLKSVRPVPAVPPMTRKAGKKGPSDEERLMILKMLQDKLISVDEAEALFKALES